MKQHETETRRQRQTRRANERYREGATPSETHRKAYRQAVTTGDVDEDLVADMVDRLYEPWSEDRKQPIRRATENDRALVVERHEYGVYVRVSERLYKEQPDGVLLRPVNDAVTRRGEAFVEDVTPRSETVADYIMPVYHFRFDVRPVPLWVSKWVGTGGYDTLEAAREKYADEDAEGGSA